MARTGELGRLGSEDLRHEKAKLLKRETCSHVTHDCSINNVLLGHASTRTSWTYDLSTWIGEKLPEHMVYVISLSHQWGDLKNVECDRRTKSEETKLKKYFKVAQTLRDHDIILPDVFDTYALTCSQRKYLYITDRPLQMRINAITWWKWSL